MPIHNDEIRNARRQYAERRLTESEMIDDPIAQFNLWFDDAVQAAVDEPNAAAFASAGPDGQANVRFVLLRGFDERGFSFFTNYESVKATEVAANPQCALAIYWHELSRQIRAAGRVEMLSTAESDEYFASRPRLSQIGAWASNQSRPLASRQTLEAEVQRLEEFYEGKTIPRPAHWGGYVLIPETMEFWQGHSNRLHDRFRYVRDQRGWSWERLAP